MRKQKVVLSEKLYPAREKRLYAHAIKKGNAIYISGQTARTKEHEIVHKRDIVGQIDVVFQNMQEVLQAAGAGMREA